MSRNVPAKGIAFLVSSERQNLSHAPAAAPFLKILGFAGFHCRSTKYLPWLMIAQTHFEFHFSSTMLMEQLMELLACFFFNSCKEVRKNLRHLSETKRKGYF